MPSNYTPNYNLNQWEADDRVLRTDFNADNTKIDAAIKAQVNAREALAGQVALKADRSALTAEVNAREAADAALSQRAGFQLISRTALGEEKRTANLDMSGVAWGQWAEVCVLFKPVLVTSSSYIGSYQVDLETTVNNRLTTIFYGPCHILLYPFFDESAFINGQYSPFDMSGGGLLGRFFYFQPFSNLKDFSFYPKESQSFQAGSVFEIWGRK